MTINSEFEHRDQKQWLRLGKMVFVGCAAYGIVIGSIFHFLSLQGTLSSGAVLALDYPGLVTFFILEGALTPYGGGLGLLIPSIIAWSSIGFIPYAIARFKVTIEQASSSGSA